MRTWLTYSCWSCWVFLFFFFFETGKWLKLFFISLLTIPWVKPKLDIEVGINCTARFTSGVERPRVPGSFVQCSMFFSAYFRGKNRHSLCLLLLSLPSFGAADSTVLWHQPWGCGTNSLEKLDWGDFSPRKYTCVLTSHLIFPAYFIKLPKKSLMRYYIFKKMLKCLF